MTKLQKRNEAFAALSITEKRLAVIQDVLDQLDNKRYRLILGNYFVLRDDNGKRVATDADLQELLLDTDVSTCSVCARGAFFASLVRLSDGVRIPGNSVKSIALCDISSVNPVFSRKEDELFTPGQKELIECAYMADASFRGHLSWDEVQGAVEFGLRVERKIPSSKKDGVAEEAKLRAILANMQANAGFFVP